MGVTVSDGHAASGQFTVSVYGAEAVAERVPGWDALPPGERHDALLAADVQPQRRFQTDNVTCVGLDEAIVDALDPNQPNAVEIDNLAVGDDDSTTPAHSDTSLNNKVGEVSLSSSEDQTSTIFGSWYIDTSELNGNDLKEVGVLDNSSRLLNHATISSVSKTNNISVTVEVKLSFTNQ